MFNKILKLILQYDIHLKERKRETETEREREIEYAWNIIAANFQHTYCVFAQNKFSNIQVLCACNIILAPGFGEHLMCFSVFN